MRQLKLFALIILTALSLSACTSSQEQVEQAPEPTLYQKAETFLQDENYSQAIRYLEAMRNRFPSSVNSEPALLNLIYANYKVEDYTAALVFADRFLQEFPTSPYLDYVVYMAGLTNFSLSENFIQDFFKVDRANRESTSLKSAFANFQTLVQHFPQSRYAEDAKARMAYITETLARHELGIVKFYAKRDAQVAVSNRVLGMMQSYPETKATYQALPLLQKAYEAMNLQDLASKTAKIIEDNRGKTFADVAKPERKKDVPPPTR